MMLLVFGIACVANFKESYVKFYLIVLLDMDYLHLHILSNSQKLNPCKNNTLVLLVVG